MSKGLKILAMALLLTVAAASLAGDASYPRAGKTWNINLLAPTKVGTVVLPPGVYKVQHVLDGEKHVLVFKNTNEREKARATCTFQPLDKKVEQNIYRTSKNDAGQDVLLSVDFAGGRFRQVLQSVDFAGERRKEVVNP